MKTAEAIEICEGWFAYIERQRLKSIEVQKLATMARNGQQAEAQKRLRQLDTTSVTVYDGSRLEPAVRHLVKLARSGGPRYPHWHCKTHGDFDARVAVGCPECMREAREQLRRLAPVPSCGGCDMGLPLSGPEHIGQNGEPVGICKRVSY